MEKSQEMVKEITKIRKMTYDVKKKMRIEIEVNIVASLVLSVYNLGINIIYFKIESWLSNILLKILAVIAICITVIIFEKSYRDNSKKEAIFGIECFFFSVYFLCISRIYSYLSYTNIFIWIIFPVFCILYYAFKSFIIYKKTKFVYQNNLSDIKEIMKDE